MPVFVTVLSQISVTDWVKFHAQGSREQSKDARASVNTSPPCPELSARLCHAA